MPNSALPGQPEYLEQAVLLAYTEGAKDMLLMIDRAMYDARLDRIVGGDKETVLRLTHGLLAPEPT